jgi:hypothetical protein
MKDYIYMPISTEGFEFTGPVYDCELIPVYQLNGDVFSYLVLLYCEGTPKKPWQEILDEIYPDYLVYKGIQEKVWRDEKKML